MHLKEHQVMLWCRFLTHLKDLYPNISMVVEILVVLLASSSVVERGFSTLRRILKENRLSMKNDRLSQSLVVRCNLPVLRKLKNDYEKILIQKAVEIYLERKKWRWGIRHDKDKSEKVLFNLM